MALVVERLTARTFSLTHYFELNGDLVPDPDMEFWCSDDGPFFPLAIQHASGIYVQALTMDDACLPDGANLEKMRSLIVFANAWMRNIRSQQSRWFEEREQKA